MFQITAAHICYLVAEANFESYSDSARLCLIGSDHWKFPRTYASPEAIQVLSSAILSFNFIWRLEISYNACCACILQIVHFAKLLVVLYLCPVDPNNKCLYGVEYI